MRLSGSGWVHSMNSPLRWCLCLVLVCLICLISIAATGGTAGSSAKGPLPKIEQFKADPMVLEDNQAALYTFVVKHATKIQVIEAGNTIKEVNNPTSATLKGTVKGLSADAIQTGDSPTFDTILLASNESGNQERTLTLSFANVLQPTGLPAGSTDSKTEPRSPKWLAQYSSPFTSTPSTSPKLGSEPVFFKCPGSCEYCLKPEDAAGRGFTQRCAEERCYYSPDDQQNWYCYSEPEGWCCRDTKVSQATKTQCAQAGGSYWSTNQAEAMRACQPIGWCCRDGQIAQATKDQCAQAGGSYWSTNQAEAMRACQRTYWCCSNGKIYTTTQPTEGCYTNLAAAQRACERPPTTYWCCRDGKVYPTTTPGAGCYATQAEATRACQPLIRTPTLK